MNDEPSTSVLAALLLDAETEREDERKAEAEERAAFMARLDSIEAQIKALGNDDDSALESKLDALMLAVSNIKMPAPVAAAPAPAAQKTITLPKKGAGSITVTVTARDATERISAVRIE